MAAAGADRRPAHFAAQSRRGSKSVRLAWGVHRGRDRFLAASFLAWTPIGLAALALDPSGQVPSLAAMLVFATALTSPPLIVGFVRMVAPRRWLLK